MAKALMLALTVALAGCSTSQIDKTDAAIAKACQDIMPLARIAAFIPGPAASISAYAIAACDTIAGLAKLRADPTSVAWLAKLRDDLRRLGF